MELKRPRRSVYIMRTEILGGGRTKVGVSVCVQGRHRVLRRHRKLRDLRIVREWPRNGDAFRIERLVCQILRPYRVGHEYFDVSAAHACRVVTSVSRLLDRGWTPGQVAEKYGVARQTIYIRFNSERIAQLRADGEQE